MLALLSRGIHTVHFLQELNILGLTLVFFFFFSPNDKCQVKLLLFI